MTLMGYPLCFFFIPPPPRVMAGGQTQVHSCEVSVELGRLITFRVHDHPFRAVPVLHGSRVHERICHVLWLEGKEHISNPLEALLFKNPQGPGLSLGDRHLHNALTVSRVPHAQQGVDDLLLDLFIVLRIYNPVRIPSLEVNKDVGMARFQRKSLRAGPVNHHPVGFIIKIETNQAGLGQMMLEIRVPLNRGKSVV
jgi:hypothetical protein